MRNFTQKLTALALVTSILAAPGCATSSLNRSTDAHHWNNDVQQVYVGKDRSLTLVIPPDFEAKEGFICAPLCDWWHESCPRSSTEILLITIPPPSAFKNSPPLEIPFTPWQHGRHNHTLRGLCTDQSIEAALPASAKPGQWFDPEKKDGVYLLTLPGECGRPEQQYKLIPQAHPQKTFLGWVAFGAVVPFTFTTDVVLFTTIGTVGLAGIILLSPIWVPILFLFRFH